MAVREWQVQASSPHIVRLEHGYWSGRAAVLLDGIEIYRRGFTLMDFGFVQRFDIEGIEYSVHVKCHLLHYHYEFGSLGSELLSGNGSDWAVSLNRVFLTPLFRFAWSAACFVLVMLFALGDSLARSQGVDSPLAPTAVHFWLAIGLGMGLGMVAIMWERFLLLCRRQEQIASYRATFQERFEWRFQRMNFRRNGWLLLVSVALVAWCVINRIFPGPLLFAASAVAAAGNPKVVSGFKAELDRACAAGPNDPSRSRRSS